MRPPSGAPARAWSGLRRRGPVAMPVRVEVARLVAWMVVMRPRHLGHARVAMAMRVEVAGGVAGVVVMGAGHLLDGLVAMPVRVEVAGGVARMIVVRTWLFLGHGRDLLCEPGDADGVILEVGAQQSHEVLSGRRGGHTRCSSH